MLIDLNDPTALTMDSVKLLLASKDDSCHRQLRVSKSGIAYLSDDAGARNLEEVLFRLETWDAGNSYCGVAAANDDSWAERVFNALKTNWPNSHSSYIDSF